MKISELKPLQKNPFKSTGDEQIKRIAKSIHEFERMMEIRKIVIDENNNILGGNKRYFALKNIGYKEIPDAWIEKVEGLTDEQKREFIVKDNAHWGSEWDYELLSEWNVDLEAWGVEDVEFADEKEAKEDDYEIPDEIETDIVLGDLIEIGEHRLLCGDSTDSEQVAKLMNGKKADMVFTDPPYNANYKSRGSNSLLRKGIKNDNMSDNEFDKFVKTFISNLLISINDGASLYCCCNWKDSYPCFYYNFQDAGINISANIVWNKKSAGMGWQDYRYQYEFIIYGFKIGSKHNWYGERLETDIWELSRDTRTEYKHPTQKPIQLSSKAMQNSSKEGDIVLDLFLGSGSTMVAAHQLNRKCYGMEIDPIYCQVIINRMRKLDNTLVIKKNGVEI